MAAEGISESRRPIAVFTAELMDGSISERPILFRVDVRGLLPGLLQAAFAGDLDGLVTATCRKLESSFEGLARDSA
jgi:hypothetical protein